MPSGTRSPLPASSLVDFPMLRDKDWEEPGPVWWVEPSGSSLSPVCPTLPLLLPLLSVTASSPSRLYTNSSACMLKVMRRPFFPSLLPPPDRDPSKLLSLLVLSTIGGRLSLSPPLAPPSLSMCRRSLAASEPRPPRRRSRSTGPCPVVQSPCRMSRASSSSQG